MNTAQEIDQAGPDSLPANTHLGPRGKVYNLEVRLAEVTGFPYNPRRSFPVGPLAELAGSIREHGLLEPIVLRKVEALNGLTAGYEGLAGERRFRACEIAGLESFPARVFSGITPARALAIASVENLQRADLDPIEEAAGLRNLQETAGLTVAELAEVVGKPRSSVANALRLLRLPEPIREMIAAGRLTPAHGLHFLRWEKVPRGAEIMAALAELALEDPEAPEPANTFKAGVPFAYELENRGLIAQDFIPGSEADLRELLTEAEAKDLIFDGNNVYSFDGADYLKSLLAPHKETLRKRAQERREAEWEKRRAAEREKETATRAQLPPQEQEEAEAEERDRADVHTLRQAAAQRLADRMETLGAVVAAELERLARGLELGTLPAPWEEVLALLWGGIGDFSSLLTAEDLDDLLTDDRLEGLRQRHRLEKIAHADWQIQRDAVTEAANALRRGPPLRLIAIGLGLKAADVRRNYDLTGEDEFATLLERGRRLCPREVEKLEIAWAAEDAETDDPLGGAEDGIGEEGEQ